MKMKMKLALVVGVATLAVTPVFAKGGGKDSLHLSYRQALSNDGVEPDATGTVNVTESLQGNANNQKLDVTAAGLTAATDYDIVVNVNGSGTTDLGTFTTDGKGKLSVHLGNRAHGKGGAQLPTDFDLSQIIELDIVNGSAQPVLSVDTTAPASLKYMATRNLNNGGSANGSLLISSTKGRTRFSLTATGLDSGTDYQLIFNGSQADVVTSDSHGRLKVSDATLPANILDLQTVEVWDASNTAVLGTSTPLP